MWSFLRSLPLRSFALVFVIAAFFLVVIVTVMVILMVYEGIKRVARWLLLQWARLLLPTLLR